MKKSNTTDSMKTITPIFAGLIVITITLFSCKKGEEVTVKKSDTDNSIKYATAQVDSNNRGDNTTIVNNLDGSITKTITKSRYSVTETWTTIIKSTGETVTYMIDNDSNKVDTSGIVLGVISSDGSILGEHIVSGVNFKIDINPDNSFYSIGEYLDSTNSEKVKIEIWESIDGSSKKIISVNDIPVSVEEYFTDGSLKIIKYSETGSLTSITNEGIEGYYETTNSQGVKLDSGITFCNPIIPLSGGLMQLVAKGAQDVYLTSKPCIAESDSILKFMSGMGGLAFSN